MAKKDMTFLNRLIRQISVYLIGFVILVLMTYLGINFAANKYVKPVDIDDSELVNVEIPRGSSLGKISQILYDNNLIRNKTVFKLYVDFSNKTPKLKAGKYQLSKSMDMADIMEELIVGSASIDTVKITIIEGWDIRKIAKYLVHEKEFEFTEKEFIETAKVESFPEFGFLQEIPEERKAGKVGIAPIEGYLFPDTYIVYQDATPKDIMGKMLDQFENVYNSSILERAQMLELDMDEVVTLASVIQREARISEEFPKISAVFHNRIREEMPLGSCATIQFLINEDRWKITEEEQNIDSPYNTYINKGLPIGPIASPGQLALVSAVNPYEDFMESSNPYLYFVLKDPETGEHVFNVDYKQHLQDKKLYEDGWDG